MAIAEVLKFDGSADIFAWKFPNSELSTWSQLIVNESQEAILVKNGQVTDVFGPGRYVLSTDNIPILQKFINLPFGKRSPFSAEVWFINKAFSLDIKWGTTSPIQIQDPKYKVFIPIRAFGQFGIQITDPKRFLIKLVGTMPFFNKETLTNYFRGTYITRAKDAISTSLVEAKVSVLEINAHLNELSDLLQNQLQNEMEVYGITVVSFFVNDINVPENDPAVKQLKNALAKRAEMDIIGYSYQQERTFNTLETAADNPGASGTLMGAGMGMGMGFGMGNAFGNQTKNFGDVMATENKSAECPKCHGKMDESSRFCPHCGLDVRAKQEKKAESRCSACGYTYSGKLKFCPECGRKFRPCAECGTDIPDDASACPGCGKVCCPQCGSMLSSGVKFCPECGYSFSRKCSTCGNTISGKEKFCSECGTPVQ